MNFPRRISRPRSKNLINILSDSALNGGPIPDTFQTAHLALQNHEFYETLKLNVMFECVVRLEEILTQWKPVKDDVITIFWDISVEIREISKRDFNRDKNIPNPEAAKWTRDFLLQRALEVLQRFMTSCTYLPFDAALEHERSDMLQMKGIALEIVHTLCLEFEPFAIHSANNDNFLHTIFSYLQYDQTCFPACRLLKCLSVSRTNSYDLSEIPCLKGIVMGLEDIQLGNFCKILAITLSELDMYENKTSLYAQTKQKKNQSFYVRDVNQDVILRIPNILSRLVDIACAKPYLPWFPSGQIEHEQWVRWIEETDNIIMKDETELYFGGISPLNCPSTPGKTASRMGLELTFRADAVCVLGLLLVGRHRKEVQKELAELRLIPKLADLFDHFIWRSNTRREASRLPGHNNSCECSPEVALKIQVLRLIHSFCDHSDYKHVMLSWSEYSELQAMQETLDSGLPPWLSREPMCVGMKGLLTKIVEIIKKETGASTFRFWLSRAIESYLRGSCSSADQDFLLRRDLLKHVTQNLLTSNIRHKEVLQSSFDLLGELVKFNINAFIELNNHVNNTARQKKLISLMNSSLVDSNMFIRSLMLSYEEFITSDDEDVKVFTEECCHVLMHIGSLKTRVNYLQRLLNLINIHNLTQENVSCLNTALVILMFGLKNGELPKYLECLASNLEGCSVATNNSGVYLDNLRNLLLFWQDHYLQKDKDCTILEKSSRICFQKWRDTVTLLTSEDKNDRCAIAYYTVTALSSRAS